MDPQTSFVLASIACGLSSTCVVLSLWSFIRSSRLEASVEALETKLPPARVTELSQAFDGMNQEFQSVLQKNKEWKQSVSNSVQRLDQVMRRNEQAATRVLDDSGELNPDIVKGEIPPDVAPSQSAAAESGAMGKQAALRLRWNKNRGV